MIRIYTTEPYSSRKSFLTKTTELLEWLFVSTKQPTSFISYTDIFEPKIQSTGFFYNYAQ